MCLDLMSFFLAVQHSIPRLYEFKIANIYITKNLILIAYTVKSVIA